jgi:hypothetical protein
MNTTQKTLLLSAVAGILGVAIAAGPSSAGEKMMKDGGKAEKETSANKCSGKMSADSIECHGVNKCAGKGKCGGEGHGCAGSNSCKGQGWLPMPKDSCLAIEGGSLTPVKKG